MLAYSVLVVFAHGSALSLSFFLCFPSFFSSSTPPSPYQSSVWKPIFDFLYSLHTFDPCRSQFSQVFLWLLQGRRFWVNQEKTSSIPLFMFRAFVLAYNKKRSRIDSSVHSFTSFLPSPVSKGWFSFALSRTWSFLENEFGSSGGTSNWMRSLVAVSHHPELLNWKKSIPACTHERVGDRQCHKRRRSCWHRNIFFHVTGLPASFFVHKRAYWWCYGK